MNEQLIKEFQPNEVVKRENSWPITSWHFILLSPQNTANYKAPRIAVRFCYHYSEINKNLPSVMQKPNHRSARVRDDTSSPARVSDVISNPAHVSDDTSRPIRLWHVSPIRLRHVLLTHPQTPINRSFPKAFQESWRRPRFRSPETLLEPSLKATKNFNFEYEEHSKRNHPNHLPRSQRSLESSSKASRNFNKPQIGEALQIQASKTPKNFHHKPLNTKNIRSGIIQTTCLDLKVH